MKNLYLFSKKYLINIIIAGIMSILISVSNIFTVNFVKIAIDESIYGNLQNLPLIILKALGFIILGAIFTYCFKYEIGYFNANVLKDIREKVVSHLLKLSPDFIQKQNYGDMISRLTNEVNDISSYLSDYFSKCISLPIMLVVFSIYLFSINPSLAFFCLIPALIGIPVHSMLITPVKKGQKIYVQELSKTNNNIQECYQGIDIVKSYKLENTLSKRYYDRLKKTLDTSFYNDKREYLAAPCFNLITDVPMIIALCYGGYLSFQNKISLGDLTAFVTSLGMLLYPLQTVYQLFVRTRMVMISADRVFFILDVPVEDDESKISKKQTNDTVFELENINFAYNDVENLALENINLTINKGESVAFVGKSGCGKSTLLKLLYKHFNKTSGTIKFYGIDYEDVSVDFLRSNISLISQDTFLFPMTILENIKMGRADATYEEIIEASKSAYCHDFIMEFEKGYDTIVGEKGSLISGGQKQRISIARAFLKNSDIILLDEPTSALDKQSEKLVNDALVNIGKDKTIVVIAHRIDTIVDYDKIVVFDKKKINSVGKHKQLLEHDALYESLYTNYYDVGGVDNASEC